MKRVLIALGVFLVLIGGVFWWRASHPPLTDSQQISANLDAIAEAANARRASGVGAYLAPKFEFNGIKKGDFQRNLFVGMQQYRVVNVKTAAVQINVSGETATSRGSYILSLRSEYDSPPEMYSGNFTLRWEKIDGEWKVVGVEGARIPSPTSG